MDTGSVSQLVLLLWWLESIQWAARTESDHNVYLLHVSMLSFTACDTNRLCYCNQRRPLHANIGQMAARDTQKQSVDRIMPSLYFSKSREAVLKQENVHKEMGDRNLDWSTGKTSRKCEGLSAEYKIVKQRRKTAQKASLRPTAAEGKRRRDRELAFSKPFQSLNSTKWRRQWQGKAEEAWISQHGTSLRGKEESWGSLKDKTPPFLQ